ncbi:MAG TPA: sensor histidine kinase [Pilimelia sp.]|nr:sensor histidine kinase [Pilimelia sp.]
MSLLREEETEFVAADDHGAETPASVAVMADGSGARVSRVQRAGDGPKRWLREPGQTVAALRARPPVADALLALAAVAVEVLLTIALPPAMRPDWWPLAIGWIALCAVPVALRRVAPWLAVALTIALLVPTVVFDVENTLTMVVSYAVLTYTAAAHFTLRRAAAAALLLWIPVLVVVAVDPEVRAQAQVSGAFLVLNNLLLGLVLFLIGRTVHARRAATRALEERARAAEGNQRALAEQAVTDERRRIARELHDVVAHHVSVMGVLATGARRVLRREPQTADDALATIEDTSRTALREMRRLLDVLRTDAEPAAELAPQPGLAGIETLLEQVRDAGLPVALRVDGDAGGLDPGVALTIYRIVQEALTNVIKHGGPAVAEVRLRFGVYWLTVEVCDTGRGPGPANNTLGHGLVGMRERVALYGGTLRTGPRSGGGFRVFAKIPVEQSGRTAGEGAR